MDLYTPVSLGQRLFKNNQEWLGEYKGYNLRSVFQPIFSKSLSHIYGYEGLVRVSYQGETINPLDFFANFTQDTEIANIGAICASLHVRNFAQANLTGKIFLNSHPTMFARVANDQYSVDKAIERILLEGMQPDQVIWEVTEFKESDTNDLVSGLNLFRNAGSMIAIDDYGQLESNEHRVNLLNPNIIKIDRSLIREHCYQQKTLLLELAKLLDKKGFIIILEGIETQEEHQLMQAIPHHYVQGFLYGKPSEATKLNTLFA